MAYQPYTSLGSFDGAEVLLGVGKLTRYWSMKLSGNIGRAHIDFDAQPTSLIGLTYEASLIKPISDRIGFQLGSTFGNRFTDPIVDVFGGVSTRFWVSGFHVGVTVLPIR